VDRRAHTRFFRMGAVSFRAVPEMRVIPSVTFSTLRSPLETFSECPHCGGELHPEQARDFCESCGWRDSCCD